MCYSSTASFTSAAFLITVGAVTTFKNENSNQRMLALTPFFFGIQQAAEGFVWVSLPDQSRMDLAIYASKIFLIFALVIWPSWIPWSLYKIEPLNNRKRILGILGFLGLSASILATWVLFITEIKPYVTKHSLAYEFLNIKRHWPPNLEFIIYFLSAVIPFFISSIKTIRNVGIFIAFSMIITEIINKEASASVWCFFAAIISLFTAACVLKKRNGFLN